MDARRVGYRYTLPGERQGRLRNPTAIRVVGALKAIYDWVVWLSIVALFPLLLLSYWFGMLSTAIVFSPLIVYALVKRVDLDLSSFRDLIWAQPRQLLMSKRPRTQALNAFLRFVARRW